MLNQNNIDNLRKHELIYSYKSKGFNHILIVDKIFLLDYK